MHILQPTRQLGTPSPETVKNTVIGIVGAAALVGVLVYFGKGKDGTLRGAGKAYRVRYKHNGHLRTTFHTAASKEEAIKKAHHYLGFKPKIVDVGVESASGYDLEGPRRSRGLRGSDDVDQHASRELLLYIENDQPLYRATEAMRGAIAKKVCQGKYDHARAQKGFRAVADVGARAYAKEFGGNSARTFPGAVRNEVAKDMADDLKRNINDCLKDGHCGDAPPALLKCPSASPLAGARGRTKKRRK